MELEGYERQQTGVVIIMGKKKYSRFKGKRELTETNKYVFLTNMEKTKPTNTNVTKQLKYICHE